MTPPTTPLLVALFQTRRLSISLLLLIAAVCLSDIPLILAQTAAPVASAAVPTATTTAAAAPVTAAAAPVAAAPVSNPNAWAGCVRDAGQPNEVSLNRQTRLCFHVANGINWAAGLSYIRAAFEPLADAYARLHIPNCTYALDEVFVVYRTVYCAILLVFYWVLYFFLVCVKANMYSCNQSKKTFIIIIVIILRVSYARMYPGSNGYLHSVLSTLGSLAHSSPLESNSCFAAFRDLVGASNQTTSSSLFTGKNITVSAASQSALSFVRMYHNVDLKRVYPFFTAVVDVQRGVVKGITWDDACVFCGGLGQCTETTYDYNGQLKEAKTAGQPTRSCSIPVDECFTLLSTTPNSTECDLTFYVVWTGTDVNGQALQSHAYRFSEFPPQQLSDRFTQLIPGFGGRRDRDLQQQQQSELQYTEASVSSSFATISAETAIATDGSSA